MKKISQLESEIEEKNKEIAELKNFMKTISRREILIVKYIKICLLGNYGKRKRNKYRIYGTVKSKHLP